MTELSTYLAAGWADTQPVSIETKDCNILVHVAGEYPECIRARGSVRWVRSTSCDSLTAVVLRPSLALAAGVVLVAAALIAAALRTFPTCTRSSIRTACPALSYRSVTAVLSLTRR